MQQEERRLAELLDVIQGVITAPGQPTESSMELLARATVESGNIVSHLRTDMKFSQEFKDLVCNDSIFGHVFFGFLTQTLAYCVDIGKLEGHKDSGIGVDRLTVSMNSVSNALSGNDMASLEGLATVVEGLITLVSLEKPEIDDVKPFAVMTPRVRYSVILSFLKSLLVFSIKCVREAHGRHAFSEDILELLQKIQSELGINLHLDDE